MQGGGVTLSQPLLPGAPNGITRDLEAARGAYLDKDAAASKAAHSAQSIALNAEEHEEAGGRIKSIIFGGCGLTRTSPCKRCAGHLVCDAVRLDGILTSFAVVAGAVGVLLCSGLTCVSFFRRVFAPCRCALVPGGHSCDGRFECTG